MTTERGELHFDISASVVFQLGEQLITDEIQAFTELIKNSYDAKANFAQVIVDTNAPPPSPWRFNEARGYLLIQDQGRGMTLQQLENSWLTISSSEKRTLKERGSFEEGERVPLGDKGLGRLGSQRLGRNLELVTRAAGSDMELCIWYSWEAFEDQTRLSSVPVPYEVRPATLPVGTHIMISSLKNPDVWYSQTEQSLAHRMAKMISPFQNNGFRLDMKVNGEVLQLENLTAQVLDTAVVKYDIKFDGLQFAYRGYIKLDFLRPKANQPEHSDDPITVAYYKAIERDKGVAFLSYLLSRPEAQTYNIERSASDAWYITFGRERPLSEFAGVLLDEKNSLANPGPFSGEVYALSLGAYAVQRQTVFNEARRFRSVVKDLAGIRVFRDGFAVRVDRDWLGLGRLQTSGSSFNGLKPENTIGYIAISARHNAALEETTSREGFTATAHYRNFELVLRDFVVSTERVHNILRSAARSFYSDYVMNERDLPAATTPETISRRITTSLGQVARVRAPLADVIKRVEAQAQVTDEAVSANMSPLFTTPSELQQFSSGTRQNIEDIKQIVVGLDVQLTEIEKVREESFLLTSQIKELRDRLTETYSVVALGLTAEVISHEINQIVARVVYQISGLRDYLRQKKQRDDRVAAFLEHTYDSMTALRKQTAHLDPSLKYARDAKKQFKLSSVSEEVKDFYTSRLESRKIELLIDVQRDFSVSMSKGKAIQVFDNLVLNSEYWVQESLRLTEVKQGKIYVCLDRPVLRFWDNSIGVDPVVEDSLFEPFVTTKDRQRGRGLGLFIAQQLLESEGCSIRLLPERNGNGRQYIFEIDFLGAII